MASSAATSLGFLLLTGNTIAAIRRSRADDDASATAFAATSYASLVLLFYCLRRFETSPTGSAAKARARVGVWLTTTLLTAMFSWRVSALMPWHVSAGVCLMGAATVMGGFYALFLAPTGGD
jgi:peptidoglycan biosynthesis protein MviN/MurJ (putative lipid II flippase)